MSFFLSRQVERLLVELLFSSSSSCKKGRSALCKAFDFSLSLEDFPPPPPACLVFSGREEVFFFCLSLASIFLKKEERKKKLSRKMTN